MIGALAFRHRLMSIVPKSTASEDPLEAMYLTFEALEDGFQVTKSGANQAEYSFDGLTWNYVHWSSGTPEINKGQKMYLRGYMSPDPNYGIGTFRCNKRFRAKGNCMSLLFQDDAANVFSLSGYDYAFRELFRDVTTLVDASELKLQATTLSEWCYYEMFRGCTNLVKAPQLPAMTLRTACYISMFNGCSSLTEAPVLPALTLIGESEYDTMFSGCSSLKYIKAMFLNDPIYSTYGWVSGVASEGVFVKNKDATWNKTGDNGVPSGWTIVLE